MSSAKTRVLAELTIRFGGRLFDRAVGAIGAGSLPRRTPEFVEVRLVPLLMLCEMRGRAARRFLGEMTTPGRPGESLLQFLVGIN